MSLRFLADHCVPNSVVRKLQQAGHQVLRLQEVARADLPDSAVIDKAQELRAILLSLNGDFADIVAYPPSSYGGIVALQAQNHPEAIPSLVNRLLLYISTAPEAALSWQAVGCGYWAYSHSRISS